MKLVAVLLTEGWDDALHRSFRDCYVELDESGGGTVLYLDVGDPKVRGPVAKQLVRARILSDDMEDIAAFKRGVREAGGERAYRRMQMRKLRWRVRMTDEKLPCLAVFVLAERIPYAILSLPGVEKRGSRDAGYVWRTVAQALSEAALHGLTGGKYDQAASSRLQAHFDIVADALETGRAIDAPVFRQIDSGDWLVGYGGIRITVGQTVGLKYLRELLAAPGKELDLRIDRPANNGLGSEFDTKDALSADAQSDLPIADEDTIRDVEKAIEDASREREESAARGDSKGIERADGRLLELQAYLGSVRGYGGRPRRKGGTASRNRDAARKGIRRAIDVLRDRHPALGEHLTASVKGLVYRPSVPIEWDT